MTPIIIICALILIAAISVFFIEKQPADKNVLQFQFKNIVLPVAICLIATVVVAFTFSYFPNKVPYKFDTDGTVTKSMAVYTYLLLMLGVQYGIVLLNIVLNFALIKLSEWITKNSPMLFNASIMQFIVTNILIIPQVIMAFILVNSVYYCVYGTILMLPMQFTLYAILISLFLLIVLFFKAYQQTRNVIFKEQ